MQVNSEVLKSYGACETGYNNFIDQYPKFDGTFLEVLDLPNIPHNDKIWLAKKMLNSNQLIHFAILTAESVMNIYNSKYPNDTRISYALSYMKTIVDFSNLSQEQQGKLIELRQGILSARRDAAGAAAGAAYAAGAAAYAAGAAAAAGAAYAAAGAAYAAAGAADAAAYAADAADAARKEQQELQISFLKIVESL